MTVYNLTKQSILAEKASVADSFLSRLVGLMGKKTIDNTEGLFIRPCRAVHTWFMRFNIDVLFLDAMGQVIYLIENMSPYKRSPYVKNAAEVLELAAGKIKSSNTKLGDYISNIEEDYHGKANTEDTVAE